MPTSLASRKPLPDWWLRFIESYPAVPTITAVTGLAFIMLMLTPTVTHPSENGAMIDSLAKIVRSGAIISKATAVRAAYHNLVPEDVRTYAQATLCNPVLYFVVPFFLLLEYLFPCNPSQPLIGKGALQDAVWFAASAPTTILLLGTVNVFLKRYYNNHLAFLTIRSASVWPASLQVVTALFVVEFLFWVSHYIRHKFGPLWFFHAVHHSQKELNVFTDDRAHVVDKLAVTLIMFIPFYIFQVPNLYAVAIVGLYTTIHSRFVHLNVKINLGWLGWVLASPQFHRVHHSADPAHWDKNFAGVLSLFDHLFGTAYPSRDIYPETGIDDAQFPIEDRARVSDLPRNWLMQVSFPFVQCFRRIAPRITSPTEEKQA